MRQESLKMICMPALHTSNKTAITLSTQPELVRPCQPSSTKLHSSEYVGISKLCSTSTVIWFTTFHLQRQSTYCRMILRNWRDFLMYTLPERKLCHDLSSNFCISNLSWPTKCQSFCFSCWISKSGNLSKANVDLQTLQTLWQFYMTQVSDLFQHN